MIVLHEYYKIKKSGAGGKGKQGYITIPSRISEVLDWKERPLSIILVPEEELDYEKLKEVWPEHLRYRKMKEELAKLKGEVIL